MVEGENISFRLNKLLVPSLAGLDGDPSSPSHSGDPSFSLPCTNTSPRRGPSMPMGNTTKLWRGQDKKGLPAGWTPQEPYCPVQALVWFLKGEGGVGFHRCQPVLLRRGQHFPHNARTLKFSLSRQFLKTLNLKYWKIEYIIDKTELHRTKMTLVGTGYAKIKLVESTSKDVAS